MDIFGAFEEKVEKHRWYKYSQIRVPYKYKKIIKQVSNNCYICIMRQEKGRDLAIIDILKYYENV